MYVLWGLPDDVPFDEDPKIKKPRVKIYVIGRKKDDVFVSYMKEPLVGLCLQILNGSSLRPSDKISMSVTPANFEHKGEKFIAKQTNNRKKKLQKVNTRCLGGVGVMIQNY